MTGRRVAAVLGFGIAGSQAGHLVSYGLRFGDSALAVQASGAHAYFPVVAKTMLGTAAMAVIAALLVIGFARLAIGRRIEPESGPHFVRLLAVVYTIQLSVFVAQETLEGSSASEVVLWGLLGQLPVAAVGALALRWLLARLGPAVAHLVARCQAALQLHPISTGLVLRPAPIHVNAARAELVAGSITRRGPPSF